MPIYNGNTKVSISGIKAAYVGNTKVLANASWHTLWDTSWSSSASRSTSSDNWKQVAYKSLSNGNTSSTKFRITYTVQLQSNYGTPTAIISTNGSTLHSLSGATTQTYTDEVTVTNNAFDSSVTTLSSVSKTTLTNCIMNMTAYENQYNTRTDMCVFIRPDVARVYTYSCITNGTSSPFITIEITKIEQFY